jgi:hypothetical protein
MCRTKDDEPVEAGGRVRFLYEDAESMSLIIKGVTAEDAGKYKVVAKNELGQDSAEMDLLVKGKETVNYHLFSNTSRHRISCAPHFSRSKKNLKKVQFSEVIRYTCYIITRNKAFTFHYQSLDQHSYTLSSNYTSFINSFIYQCITRITFLILVVILKTSLTL